MNILLDASATAASVLGNPYLMIVIIIAIMYFMMIRPQRKRQKEIENFRNSLQVGTEVITSGGIYGKIKSVDGRVVSLEVAHNVVIRVDKDAIYANTTSIQQDAK